MFLRDPSWIPLSSEVEGKQKQNSPFLVEWVVKSFVIPWNSKIEKTKTAKHFVSWCWLKRKFSAVSRSMIWWGVSWKFKWLFSLVSLGVIEFFWFRNLPVRMWHMRHILFLLKNADFELGGIRIKLMVHYWGFSHDVT